MNRLRWKETKVVDICWYEIEHDRNMGRSTAEDAEGEKEVGVGVEPVESPTGEE